jgi:hypothetical protein
MYPGDSFLLGHQLLRLDVLPAGLEESPRDHEGVRAFGTPLQPAWARLVLLAVGDVAADVHFLRSALTVFGREVGDLVFTHDAFLSRQHARIRMQVQGGQMVVFLEDLGSANGTYLRVRGRTTLSHGEMFRIGDQILRVRSD